MSSSQTNQLSSPPTVQNTSNVSPNSASSYAAVTQNDKFPKKDQAIVLEAKEGLQLKDYIFAIGNLTDPANIRFASRISNGRICMFLASKEIADSITSKHEHIKVNNNKIPLRPLMTKHKRIILSNVYPSITHSKVEEIIDNLHIRRGSPVSYLKVGVNDQNFSHIYSFRRQVFIHPDDIAKLPESFKITDDDTTHWIYASSDTVKCFLCKENGHVARQCHINTEPISYTQAQMIIPPQLNSDATQSNETNTDIPTVETNQTTIKVDGIGIKRTHSVISSSQSTTSEKCEPKSVIEEFKTPSKREKQKKKLQKTDTTLIKDKKLDNMLQPIKNILDKPNNIMNYLQFKSFLENVQGSKNPKEITLNYVEDITSLVKFMKHELYPHIQDTQLKKKFTRIANKLCPELKSTTHKSDTDMTLSDSESSTQEDL